MCNDDSTTQEDGADLSRHQEDVLPPSRVSATTFDQSWVPQLGSQFSSVTKWVRLSYIHTIECVVVWWKSRWSLEPWQHIVELSATGEILTRFVGVTFSGFCMLSRIFFSPFPCRVLHWYSQPICRNIILPNYLQRNPAIVLVYVHVQYGRFVSYLRTACQSSCHLQTTLKLRGWSDSSDTQYWEPV